MIVDSAPVAGDLDRRPGFIMVMLIEFRCMLQTLFLLIRGRIGLPKKQLGRRVSFLDGSTSRIYRETSLDREASSDMVVLVVRFRLRLLGTSRVGHALFRLESLVNTVLFAAHRGFRTKLWLTDLTTGFYRGIYEWAGQADAIRYAEILRVVLRPWVERRSFGYRIIQAENRESFLRGEVQPEEALSADSAWWLPAAAAPDDW